MNDLAILCAEFTAGCNQLSSDWLAVLIALCSVTSNYGLYPELIAQVDFSDMSVHNSIAVFFSILIARHCFSLEDFVVHIALPCLVKIKVYNDASSSSNTSSPSITEKTACRGGPEASARLLCHLILRLFKTIECPQPNLYSVSSSPHPLASGQINSIRLSCDRHLLAAAHSNISVGPVLAVLKGILGMLLQIYKTVLLLLLII